MSVDPEMEGRNWSGRVLMYYLCLIGFFAIFSTTISKSPVLPLFVQSLGAGPALLGVIAAVSPLAGVLFSFPVGVLSDHLGRRRLLVISAFVFLIAPVLYLFVTYPVWLVPIRFFHGTATAILGPVVSAIIAERFPDSRGEKLGTYASASLVGRTLAPLAGGIIITIFISAPGLFPYRMVYIAAALSALPVFVLILRYREAEAGSLVLPGIGVYKESLATFVTNRRLRATAMADMASYFAYGVFETFLPLYLASLSFAAYQTGIIFAVQVLIIAGTKPVFGRLSDRIDRRIQIVTGLLVTGIAIAAVPVASTFPGFLAASALFGLGIAVSTVATSAYVADVAKQEQIGSSMGALSSIMDIGQSSGPLITGVVITLAGYAAGFSVSLLLAAVVTVIFVFSVRGTGQDTV